MADARCLAEYVSFSSFDLQAAATEMICANFFAGAHPDVARVDRASGQYTSNPPGWR